MANADTQPWGDRGDPKRLFSGRDDGADSAISLVRDGQPVASKAQQSRHFDPHFLVVHERASADPIQLADRNPNRLELWVRTRKENTGRVFLGPHDVTGDLQAQPSGWLLEPGEGVIIDITLDAVYAVAEPGFGDQGIYFYEASK